MTGVENDFWRGRRVFVTGHSGFKGGWLAALLYRLGANVSGYALSPPSTPNLFSSLRVADLCQSQFGDIRNAETIASAIAGFGAEVVLHLAAQALVRPARAAPVETFSTNVVGTAQVLEAVRAAPSVQAVVVVTSDKVYDNKEWAWAYRESDRLGGKEPYGASKACAEIVADAYRYSYFGADERKVALATARAGNVIGGGDWAEDRLVPDAMRAFSRAEPLVVRNPAAVRPWQHALEPLGGYLLLAQSLLRRADGGGSLAFNFGPQAEDAVPVSEVADRLASRWGRDALWQHDPATQPYEARLLEVDSARARSELGWKPRWRLAQALERTVDWYKAFYSGQDMQALTLRQIDEWLHG